MWLNNVITLSFQIITVSVFIIIVWKFFVPNWIAAYKETHKSAPLFQTHVERLRENMLRIEENFEHYQDSTEALRIRIDQYYALTEPMDARDSEITEKLHIT